MEADFSWLYHIPNAYVPYYYLFIIVSYMNYNEKKYRQYKQMRTEHSTCTHNKTK